MNWELWTLAVSAFTSATVLPGTSDIALTALLLRNPNDWLSIFLVASVANSLGGIVSYGLGYWLPKRHRISESQKRALFEKYGVWALLLSWMPVIGDLLPIGAGWLRLNVWLSAVMILLGKSIRYAVLTVLVLGGGWA
jgi:membrane protein YqaA with SNARE-associated domain